MCGAYGFVQSLSWTVDEARAEVLVELKAVETVRPVHRAQVLSYLRATELELGLLINFNVPVLKNGVRRLICSRGGL